MQAHECAKVAGISEMHVSQCKEILEFGRKIIHAHDLVLYISYR